MPAEPRGWPEKLSGAYVLRYRDLDGVKQRARSSTGAVLRFRSKTAALNHFRDQIAPGLRGERPVVEYTLAEFVPVFLERHAAVTPRSRTIDTLRERLAVACQAFGDVPLRELEAMTGELAAWYAQLPEGSRYGRMQALRQALGAAKRWRYMASNPAVDAVTNRQPPPRAIRAFSPGELEAIDQELPPAWRPLPAFAAATGLRPEEWAALRRDVVDRRAGVLTVARTLTGGKNFAVEVVELAKTSGSRRQVPLTPRALDALAAVPARLDTSLIFPAPKGGPLHLDNFRKRVWAPAVEASGVERPARIYDLRSTFASNALAAGVTAFELARVMGTSVRMIERHYGTLLEGAGASIAARLAAHEASGKRAHHNAPPD